MNQALSLRGGTASHPGRRVENTLTKGGQVMEVWTLIAFVVAKLLPDIIKLAKLIAETKKNKHRPRSKV